MATARRKKRDNRLVASGTLRIHDLIASCQAPSPPRSSLTSSAQFFHFLSCHTAIPFFAKAVLLIPLTMAADIGQISELLNATLDPAQHRKGWFTVLPRCLHRLQVPKLINNF